MTTSQFIHAFIWGFILWLIGYVLGVILFPLVPNAYLGWIIMPIGILTTLWVLANKIKAHSFQEYLGIASVWVLIAILFDYFFLVKLFKPTDGYYKLDVYIYYTLTLALPLLVGWRRLRGKHE